MVGVVVFLLTLCGLFVGLSPVRYEERQRAVVFILACISIEALMILAVLLQIANKVITQAP